MNTHQNPRVAIVAPSLEILGGQGVQARSLLDALTHDGHSVAILPINPAFPSRLRWIRRIPYFRTLANEAVYLPSLRRLSAYDVVHVFSASYASFLLAPAPAMLAARLLGKRIILNYHSGEADDHLSRWGALVHPWLRLADEIVVPSEYLAGVFNRYGYRTRVIPNIVDLARFQYREPAGGHLRLLSTRNLEPYYRVDVILEAFRRIQAQRPDATLTVAGHGSEDARLKQLAPPGVRFIGRIEPHEMPGVYAQADIFLNASVVDNQPISILEAFAAGLPVVSTPVGDIPAMIEHQHTGLLVQPNDPEALAAAVLALGANSRLARRMSRQARRYLDRHSWQAVGDQWVGVYAAARLESQRTHLAETSARRPWTIPHHTL